MFPFLVGRIRTGRLVIPVEDLKFDIAFPFLVGRIRTRFSEILRTGIVGVSIPRR